MAGRALALLVGAASVLGCSTTHGVMPTFSRAPVVLISIDTLRADHLPAYGYKGVATPNLDALRRDAILFENAYAHAPLTFPSHASMFTGLLPPAHGVRDNVGYALDVKKHKTLASVLKADGYATGAAVSAWVVRGGSGLADAFDFYDDDIAVADGTDAAGQVRRSGEDTARRALAWLSRSAQGPFFLFVHLYEPHSPYAPPEPYKSRYPLAYDGTIAAADAIVGEVLAALRQRGAYDRAIVMVVSDHGEGLGDHGEEFHGILLYREALHVPLLLKLPGSRDAGTSVAAPVGLVDLFPTLTTLLGLKPPVGLDGTSVFDPARRHVASPGLYAETDYPRIHLGWSGLRSLVDTRFHLIDGPDPELYDIAQDPAERVNLVGREPAMAAAMIRALRTRGSSFAAPQAVPEEQAEKLRALGYLGGATATPDGAGLPDPKTRIHVLAAVREAFKLVAGGNDEAALVAFRKILSENPGLFDVQYEMGRTLARLGRFEEAARVFAEAAAHSPALLEPIAIAQARVMLALGRYDEAAANARVATALSPGQAHEILARVALARDDLAGAEKEAGLTRGDTMAELNAALLLAEVQMRRDRVLAALEILDHTRARLAAEKLPALRDLQFLRGDALARLGRNAEADAAFREEIAAFPTNSQAYARLAIVLGIQGRSVAEVGGLLERMMTANPGAGTARLAAKTLESMGDKARAAAWRARATSIH